MSDAQTKSCPICKASMPLSERYPLAICNAHYGECRDMQGNMVTYENEDEFSKNRYSSSCFKNSV